MERSFVHRLETISGILTGIQSSQEDLTRKRALRKFILLFIDVQSMVGFRIFMQSNCDIGCH